MWIEISCDEWYPHYSAKVVVPEEGEEYGPWIYSHKPVVKLSKKQAEEYDRVSKEYMKWQRILRKLEKGA